MDGAEIYMLMVRKTGLPILGEAVALPFVAQVEILKWDWKLANQEEVDRRAKEDEDTDFNAKSDKEIDLEYEVLVEDLKDPQADKELLKVFQQVRVGATSNREVLRRIAEVQRKSASRKASELNRDQAKTAKKALDDYGEEQKNAALKNLEFKFSKRLDFASTQMLNCMKAGEILPKVILTVFHRSVSAPLTVIVTANNLRFLEYELTVEADDTMADMKEDWKAEFSDISFAYANSRRPVEAKSHVVNASGGAAIAGAAAKMAISALQTASTFTKKS